MFHQQGQNCDSVKFGRDFTHLGKIYTNIVCTLVCLTKICWMKQCGDRKKDNPAPNLLRELSEVLKLDRVNLHCTHNTKSGQSSGSGLKHLWITINPLEKKKQMG